ncbi:MAG: C40 family peptidase [Acetobacteraceae bacterium]|nr:C40 family peptidase [Acetobacteraceae bacterium]
MLAADTDPRRNDLVTVALSQVGLPYLWGGRKPLEGFDCSGLVAYVYEQALRMSIPRVTSEQARYSTAVDDRDARAGDLVFYNTLHRDYSHVGLYIGRRRFVHSPATGAVVRVERMDGLYWLQRYNGTRRLLA